MAQCKDFLLPDIHNMRLEHETSLKGRWKNEGMLHALNNIKRDEVFKALREANNANSTKNKMAMLS